jgi:hypothetical protein
VAIGEVVKLTMQPPEPNRGIRDVLVKVGRKIVYMSYIPSALLVRTSVTSCLYSELQFRIFSFVLMTDLI